MLELAGVNFWAVLVTWSIYVVIGALWYSPVGFSKQWTKHTKIDIMKLPQSEANRAIVSVALSAVLQVVVLAAVINSLNVSTVRNALCVGGLLWLGFTAATTVGVSLYQRRSWSFILLNSSYFLVVMMIGSVLLSTWK